MTKPIQPSPSRSITSIKCPLNTYIPPLLSLKMSKPKPYFINNLTYLTTLQFQTNSLHLSHIKHHLHQSRLSPVR